MLPRKGAPPLQPLPPAHLLCPPAETNAAANKAVTLTTLSSTAPDAPLQPLVDNNASSCIEVQPSPGGKPGGRRCGVLACRRAGAGPGAAAQQLAHCWWLLPCALPCPGPAPCRSIPHPLIPPPAGSLHVDLGYTGIVGSVGVRTGAVASGAAVFSRVYVTRSVGDAPSDAYACSSEARKLEAGQWTVGACNKEGRCVARCGARCIGQAAACLPVPGGGVCCRPLSWLPRWLTLRLVAPSPLSGCLQVRRPEAL